MEGDYEENQGFHNNTTDQLTRLNAALTLAKTMPPSKLKKNLIGLISLAPEIEDNLYEKIEQPIEIDTSYPDNPFLKTEFNRDGNSYRNPFTNHYSPENTEGYRPSGIYRTLEENGSVLFAEYLKQYYGGETVGNFFVVESDEGNGNFSCGFFAKKAAHEGDEFEGTWDSFNIVDVSYDGHSYHYDLNSTVLIEMNIEGNGINLAGFLKKSKQDKKQYQTNISQNDLFDYHLVTIGELIEETETGLRQHLEAIYVARTKEVIFTTRYQNTIQEELHRQSLANDLRKLRFGN